MKIIRSVQQMVLQYICKKNSKTFNREIKKFEKILINARFKIGDSIMLFPLIREIKNAQPHVKIDILTGKDNIFMFDNNPHVNHIYTLYKKLKFVKSFTNLFQLRKNHYDIIIDVLPLKFGNFLYLKLINAELYIGDNLSNRYNIDYKQHTCYDITLPKIKLPLHISDQFLRFLKPLQIASTNDRLEVYYSKLDDAKALIFLNNFTRKKYIGLNIDGSAYERCIYKEDYDYLLTQLSSKYSDFQIIIFSLPSRYKEIDTYLQNNSFLNVSLSYKTDTIFEAMALIKYLDLLITPDTSFVHIASALNIPFVGIYSGNEENFNLWYPKSKYYKILRSPEKEKNSIFNFDKALLLQYTQELLNHTEKL